VHRAKCIIADEAAELIGDGMTRGLVGVGGGLMEASTVLPRYHLMELDRHAG